MKRLQGFVLTVQRMVTHTYHLNPPAAISIDGWRNQARHYCAYANGLPCLFCLRASLFTLQIKLLPETWDPGPWDPGIIRPGTLRPEILGPGTLWPWDVRPWTLGLATLGHGILTTRILVMVTWDPVTSNWPPPQIVLTLFVKQILKGYGMCVENVWAGIQK